MADVAAHAAYLRRLGLDHTPEPTLATLRLLHARHLERIPYENLGIMLGRPPSVDPDDCVRRVAELGRLGYCFHQNAAAEVLLRGLGYAVERRHGQVWTGDAGPVADGDLNHLVLVVRIPGEDRRWWFDAGLGDGFASPLEVVGGEVADTAGFAYRLDEVGADGWRFHHDPSGTFTGVLVTGRPSDAAAVAAAHRHLSTSPDSGFVRRFVAQRRDATGIDTVRGCLWHRILPDGASQTELASYDAWREALVDGTRLSLEGIEDGELRTLYAAQWDKHLAWSAAGRP